MAGTVLRYRWLTDSWLLWGAVAAAHLVFVQATIEPLALGDDPWSIAVCSDVYLILFIGSLVAFVLGLAFARSS